MIRVCRWGGASTADTVFEKTHPLLIGWIFSRLAAAKHRRHGATGALLVTADGAFPNPPHIVFQSFVGTFHVRLLDVEVVKAIVGEEAFTFSQPLRSIAWKLVHAVETNHVVSGNGAFKNASRHAAAACSSPSRGRNAARSLARRITPFSSRG